MYVLTRYSFVIYWIVRLSLLDMAVVAQEFCPKENPSGTNEYPTGGGNEGLNRAAKAMRDSLKKLELEEIKRAAKTMRENLQKLNMEGVKQADKEMNESLKKLDLEELKGAAKELISQLIDLDSETLKEVVTQAVIDADLEALKEHFIGIIQDFDLAELKQAVIGKIRELKFEAFKQDLANNVKESEAEKLRIILRELSNIIQQIDFKNEGGKIKWNLNPVSPVVRQEPSEQQMLHFFANMANSG